MAIAVSLCAGLLIGPVTPVAFTVAMPALGLIALALVGHAIFINGPVDRVDDLTNEVEPDTVPNVVALLLLPD